MGNWEIIRFSERAGRERRPAIPGAAARLRCWSAAANLAQGLRPSQMAEQHSHKPTPISKPAGVTLINLEDVQLPLPAPSRR